MQTRWQRLRRPVAIGIVSGLLTWAPISPAEVAKAPATGRQSDEISVAGGEFVYGDDQGEDDERPSRRISLPAFFIDHTEVTTAAYARCVAAGKCQARGGSDADPRLPVVGVSYDDAVAYCAYIGRRLPSEQEWEKAARGVDGRTYPWGNDFSCSRGNFGNFGGDGRCAEDGAPGKPVPVGSFGSGASPFGALDMAGNVWEWVESRNSYAPDRSTQAGAAELRVIRGGGCCSILGLPRASNRIALPRSYRDVDIGFRCARSAGSQVPQLPPRPTAGSAGPR